MKLTNTRNGNVIDQIFEAKSLKDKSLGLINKKRQIVYFETRTGIHTFGVKGTTKIVIFDNSFLVVRIFNLKPNRAAFWNPIFSKVLEIRKDFKDLDIHIGDKFVMTKEY